MKKRLLNGNQNKRSQVKVFMRKELRTIIISFLIILASACFILAQEQKQKITEEKDNIQYPPLSPRQKDCEENTRSDSICRVKRLPSITKLKSQLANQKYVWLEGNQIVFAYQGKADSVKLIGFSGWSLAKVSTTNIWGLVLNIPEVNRAIISYQFRITNGSDSKIEPFIPLVWRGTKARKEPKHVKKLQGNLTEEIIQSLNLSEARKLTIYAPKLRASQRIKTVIYLADGDKVRYFAPFVTLNTLKSNSSHITGWNSSRRKYFGSRPAD